MIDLYGALKMGVIVLLVLLLAWGAQGVRHSYTAKLAAGEPLDTTWHDMGRGVKWKVLPLDSLGWDCVVIQTMGTANLQCMRQFR